MILSDLSNANDDVQKEDYRTTNKLLLDLIYMHARFIVLMRLPDHVFENRIVYFITSIYKQQIRSCYPTYFLLFLLPFL